MFPLAFKRKYVQFCLTEKHTTGDTHGKESACDAEDPVSIPGSERSPGEGNGNPLQYSAWKISWKSLVGYSPRGRKELDMTVISQP